MFPPFRFLHPLSSLVKVLENRASDQLFLGRFWQRRRIRSPSSRCLASYCHFLLDWCVRRNSSKNQCQNTLARCWTCRHCLLCRSAELKIPRVAFKLCVLCVSKVAGVRISRSAALGSVGTGTRGFAFTMAITSAASVERTSWERRLDLI